MNPAAVMNLLKTKPAIAIGSALIITALAVGLLQSGFPERGKRARASTTQVFLTTSPVLEAGACIEAAAAALRQGTDAINNARVIDGLRRQLSSVQAPRAGHALRAALDSGIDASTGLDLTPGGDGRFATVSSLRILLLEELLVRDAAAARKAAKQMLAEFTSPDEWAASLAVCATEPSEGTREFLQEKARALVLHEPWQRRPTAGFLEVFDVFVFTHDTAFVPELASFVGQVTNRALAHAAFLALDRLAFTDTAATLNALVSRPDAMPSRPATRAGYFARADVRESAQRAVLERYLLHPSLSPAELDHFVQAFPNANFMMSRNLLTVSTTPDLAWIRERDAASRAVVDEWLADRRFESLRPALIALKERIEGMAAPTVSTTSRASGE